MFIKRITQIEDILRFVPIECKLREKEKTPVRAQELLAFVQSQLANPMFYAIGVYEDESEQDIVGYMILMVIPYNLMDMKSVNILRVYYDHKYRRTNIREIGWQIITEVARLNNIKKVRIEVKRGMKAYEKTWKFKQVSTVMERRV